MRKTMLAVASHASPSRSGEISSKRHAISALAALAQPTRLAIFRLLIKHEPVGITAGVIADTVGAPHNTLSSHLAILVRAGLLRSSREGRTIIYRSDVEGMQSLIVVSDQRLLQRPSRTMQSRGGGARMLCARSSQDQDRLAKKVAFAAIRLAVRLNTRTGRVQPAAGGLT